MNFEYKRVLYIDLENSKYEFKMHEDLWKYVGGVGVAYKLLTDNIDLKPIILSTGPLSGCFPYMSKTCLVYISDNKVNELYGGGSLAAHMNMADVDAIVMYGRPDENTTIEILQNDLIIAKVGKTEIDQSNWDFSIQNKHASSLGYFSFGSEIEIQDFLFDISIRLEPSESIDLKNYYDYEKLYTRFLDEYKKLTVEPRGNPSCVGCPMGCELSHEGEEKVNAGILTRCLISCGYAEQVYKDIPTIYACLNSVGYNYHHSQLEQVPHLVGDLRAKLSNAINSKLETK